MADLELPDEVTIATVQLSLAPRADAPVDQPCDWVKVEVTTDGRRFHLRPYDGDATIPAEGVEDFLDRWRGGMAGLTRDTQLAWFESQGREID